MTGSLATFRDGGFELAALHAMHAVTPPKAIGFCGYCVRRNLAEADRPA